MGTTDSVSRLIAPFSGRIVELDQVPDPVFSERMTGDGLAILAEDDEVLAPCDGTISLFFDTKHAFALTTEYGIQILVHFGLDTVILNGQGITALHHPGEHVTAGTPVIRVDFELLVKKGINLNSPLLIVNYDRVKELRLKPPGSFIKAGMDTAIEYRI